MNILRVGVNQFKYHPEATLSGCVNDATDMAELLSACGHKVTLLTDNKATLKDVTKLLKEYANAGDMAFHLSSHGTQVPDTSGDEPDRRDEAFVLHDTKSDFSNLLTDDMLFDILSGTKGRVELFLDTCHSGTGQRFVGLNYKAKYLPNLDTYGLLPKKTSIVKELADYNKKVVLWSGCQADEYSYDAFINRRFNGAFTRAWINTYDTKPRSCRASIHRSVNKLMQQWDFNQHPQLECGFFNRYSGLKLEV